jgi:hypothetical protein
MEESFDEFVRMMQGAGGLVNEGKVFEWDLWLDDEQLNYSAGLAVRVNGPRAPWLDEDLLIFATGVEEEGDAVRFTLRDGQMLLVRKDGVLLHQVAVREREMKLVSVEPLGEWSVEEHMGVIDLDAIVEERVKTTPFLAKMMQDYYRIVLLEAVAGELDFEAEEEFFEDLKLLYRPLTEQMLEEVPVLTKMKELLRAELRRGWKEFQVERTARALEVGYEGFLRVVKGPTWKNLMAEEEGYLKWMGPLLPPMFPEGVRANFRAEEQRVARELEAWARRAWTHAVLAECLEQAVDAEMEVAGQAGVEKEE